MKGRAWEDAPRTLRWIVGTSCFSLWLVHPILQPEKHSAMAAMRLDVAKAPNDLTARSQARLSGPSERIRVPLDLPEPPQGFWNRRARRQWANFSLTLPGARIIAEANRGIVFEIPGRGPLQFDPGELSAVVEIPSTQRIVIGDAAGRLRLWDLTAGMPVSLIGIHQGCVNSLAFHETAGLTSADETGAVMRWDLQSGQALATWAGAKGPVQSVRYASNGQTIAVLTGHWNQSGRAQQVYLVDSQSLQTRQSIIAPPHSAVVLQSPDSQWLAVDWAGRVHLLTTGRPVAEVSKHHVSALVFSQQSPLAFLDPENLD